MSKSKKIAAFLLPFLLFSQAALGSSKYGPTSGGGGAVNQVHAGTNVTVTGTTADPIVNATGGGAVSSVSGGSGCVTFSPTTGAVIGTSTACLSADFSNVTSASGARTALGLGTLATQSGTFSGTSSGTNTGDQTITLTGDITGSGTGSFSTLLSATIPGISGGRSITGGTASGNGITLSTTSNATKGTFTIGTSAGLVYSEATNQFSIGTNQLVWDATGNGWLGVGTATTDFGSLANVHGISISSGGTGSPGIELKRGTAVSSGTSIDGGIYFFNGGSDIADIQAATRNATNSGALVFTTNNAGSDLSKLEISNDGQDQFYNTTFTSFTSSGTKLAQAGGRVFEIATTPPTLASGAAITLDAVRVDPITTTLTGTTAITTAAGFNLVDIEAPTFTDASAVTITNAATLAVKAAPIAAGSVTITNPLAFWVQSGSSVFGSAALSTSATSGFIYVPSSAGTPTGVPVANTGTVPIEYDTTNSKLCAFRSAAWACIAL